jgi:K+-transporting ATPase KdpC subunit
MDISRIHYLDRRFFIRSVELMKNQLRPLLTIFVLLTVLTGVIYPLLITGLSQVFFPSQANGSLIQQGGKLVGSKLIGQNFAGDKYFWGRPSATSSSPYDAYNSKTLTGSLGSNLGPLSQTLVNNVKSRVDFLHKADASNINLIPVDLVTASGSGLDPNISVSAAYYQVPRIASARGLSEAFVTALVERFIENRQYGIFGEPRINVLMLNLALDGIK